MSRVILLGAGASFGCEEPPIATPPLSKDLFAALEARGGVAALLPADLKEQFRKDFEGGMGKLFRESQRDVMRFQRELAHFLAEFWPRPRNAYISLLRAVNLNRCIFCTLNYDLLIELSAAFLGKDTQYSNQGARGQVRLIKPHGSSNFWPDLGGGIMRGVTLAYNARADIQAKVRPISQRETISKCLVEDSLAPAMAIYTVGKPVKVSPDFVERQQEYWEATVATASVICIAGTRVHPVDTHIWTVLSRSKARIHYFGMGSDREAFDQWKTESGKRNATFREADFRSAVPELAMRVNRA